MPCFSTYIQNVGSRKTSKKQFKILGKGKYVTPVQIFEAFKGIADDPTMNDDEHLQLIELLKMQTCKCCMITLSTHSIQCCCIDLYLKLLCWFLHNSNTRLKIIKLNSAKNAISLMLFVCFLYVMSLVGFFKISITFLWLFSLPLLRI